MQRIKKRKFDLASVILWMLTLIPLIDTLNGYLLKGGSSSTGIGSIYRLLFLGIIFAYIILNKINKIDLSIIIVFLAFIIVQVTVSDSSYLSDSIGTTVKLFTPLMMLCAFIKLKRRRKGFEDDLNRLFERLSILFPLTILIPYFLHMGYSTYFGDVGYKAFYYATNEISFSICAMIMFLWKKLRDNLCAKYILYFVLNAASCVLLGSKIALGILLFFVFLLIAENIFVANKKKIGRSIAILVVVAAGFVILVNRLSSVIEKVFDRWIYNQSAAESSISFLFSHRNVYLIKGYSIYKEMGIGTILFGWGLGGKNTNGLILVEMDMFDILFATGVVGLISILLLYTFLIRKLSISSKIGWLYIFTSIALSFVGGHILFTGLGGMMFALVIIYSSIIRKEKKGQIVIKEQMVNAI